MFVHLLALNSFLLVSYMFLQNIIYGEQVSSIELNILEIILISVCLPSFFIFWAWMLSDFFRNKTSSKAVLWGWSLIMAGPVAVFPYFILYWRKRSRVYT
jgi:hypothetical protein